MRDEIRGGAPDESLTVEIETYEKNKAALLEKCEGQFVLIKGEEIIGTFKSIDEALAKGAAQFGLIPFLVRPVLSHLEQMRVPAMIAGLKL